MLPQEDKLTSTSAIRRLHAWSLLVAFVMASGLMSSLLTMHVRAETAPTAVATAQPAATPVASLPAPGSPASAEDETTNTAKYLVTGVVLGVLAVVVAGLVVAWFLVD